MADTVSHKPEIITEASSEAPSARTTSSRLKPKRILPTDRVIFSKQMGLLRAYAAASSLGAKPVKVAEAASIVQMAATTVDLVNSFLQDMQLITRTPEGIIVSNEAVQFARAHDWNAATAAHKLAPRFVDQWFSQALMPVLKFREMSTEEAIAILAENATAGPEYKTKLTTILDYMDAVGLISRDGNNIRCGATESTKAPAEQKPERPSHSTQPDANHHTAIKPGGETVFSQSDGGAGVIQFNISVNVNMAEFAEWDPARITAFFGGIAAVLAAKGTTEKKGFG